MSCLYCQNHQISQGRPESRTDEMGFNRLAEKLLHKGYEVHGLIRRASTFNTHRLEHLYRDTHNGEDVKLYLHYGDLTSSDSLERIIHDVQPEEVYHLAAQSHVRVSFDLPDLFFIHIAAWKCLGTDVHHIYECWIESGGLYEVSPHLTFTKQ